jgi:hypothetical protein
MATPLRSTRKRVPTVPFEESLQSSQPARKRPRRLQLSRQSGSKTRDRALRATSLPVSTPKGPSLSSHSGAARGAATEGAVDDEAAVEEVAEDDTEVEEESEEAAAARKKRELNEMVERAIAELDTDFEEEPGDIADLGVMEWRSRVEVICGGREVGVDVCRHVGWDVDGNSFAEFKDLALSKVEGPHTITRTQVHVRHKRVSKEQWIRTDVTTDEEAKNSFINLMRFYTAGVRNGWLDFKFWLKPNQLPSTTPRRGVNRASEASAQAPQPTPRTETERQMARRDDAIAELDAQDGGGTKRYWGTEIRLKWTCDAHGCPNRNKHCWWTEQNTVDNHYPLNDQIIKDWARAIEAKKLKIESPGEKLLHQLRKVRDKFMARRHSHGKGAAKLHHPSSQSTTPFAQYLVFGNDGLTKLQGMQHDVAEEPQSSPTPPMDLFDKCFSWLDTSGLFDSQIFELELIRDALRNAGFDLRGVKGMDAAMWKELRLEPGYRDRVQRGIAKWLKERTSKKSCGSSRGSLSPLSVISE